VYDDFLRLASQLHANDKAFVIATVVRCEAPTSGKPGDRAIITRDGKLTGWIGGGCAQPVVIQEAIKALKDGKSRLVRVSPTAGAEPADGITGYTMICHSGGTLDIFIEPVLEKPHLLIFGRSPVAKTLASLAKVLSYRVSVVAPQESRSEFATADLVVDRGSDSAIKLTSNTVIVVATQGEDDEGALEQALKIKTPYLAFVASKKKWSAISGYLRERGIDEERLKNVRAPAGVEIGASSPEEIAVSILAQMIEVKKKSAASETLKSPVTEPVAAKDPVCGMTVSVSSAKYISEYGGQTIYFCCAHCKTTFDKDPGRFLAAS
jgi:xanthine dehydrogenase accessory factor